MLAAPRICVSLFCNNPLSVLYSGAVLGAHFHDAMPQTHLLVLHGGFAMPTLEALEYAGEDGKLMATLARKHSAEDNSTAKSGAALSTSEHHMMGPGDLQGLSARDAIHQKRSRGENDQTIAQRLEVKVSFVVLHALF